IEQGLRATEQKVPILVHGVTGSGKTEIYIRATEQAIAQGKQVLVLVPEISLTPQILGRFSRRFPGKVGVYHSRLTDSQRYETWRKGRNGCFRIVIGPRSALAVPLNDLGLIIVDECHDDSYYQIERQPYFSAVQAASDYAALSDAQLVLGSATPTIA
ncbi:MAG TPA: DEAD/DEAH box helicase family protein, partial [Flexilinea sp.]|nr:DEAD/DEAH box helicase family protein [Flexilinea sp.]